MTVQPTYVPPARRLSKSSLLSLICGVLGCIPFVTGALAVLLGLVGIFRTSNPLKSGRWMAVVGLLLGVLSLGAWTLFGGVIGGAVWGVVKITEAPRVATHDFIKALADDDMAKATSLAPGISHEQLTALGEYVKGQGKFEDTTFTNTSINNNTATLSGTAKFSTGKQNVSATLETTKGTDWKIIGIRISP